MRNRVALKAARTAAMTSKLVLVMVLVPAALVVAAQGASAATMHAANGVVAEVAADNNSFGILGPVGIAAVAVGFGGLILGLLRHRRREATAATVTLPVDASGALPVLETTQPVEPVTGERVG